jgi:hypothetical protein
MLLAFLGVGGERTDIGGHVAGFVAGILLALAIHFLNDRIRKDRAAQLRFGAAALTVFAGAWIVALSAA